MDKYISPEIEVIIFSDVDVMDQSSDVQSQDGYVAPNGQATNEE